MAKISVVVPVYNSETFLPRCINSILSQTFYDIELLLIDDGSCDKSGQICDSYAAIDRRVRVVHKENKGVSSARNVGIDIATSEYITFVDSDDWIEPVMYEKMMHMAEEYNCDVVLCDCVKDAGNRHNIYSHDIRSGYYNYEQLKEEYYPHLLMMENIEYPATISNWVLLYKVKKSNILYPVSYLRYVEGVRYSEDLLFGAEIMLHSKSFYYMKGCAYYHYCMNASSASHTFVRDKWRDYIWLYKETEKRIRCSDFDFQDQLYRMLLFFIYNAAGDIIETKTLTFSKKIKEVRNILDTPETRKMFRNIRIRELCISRKGKAYTALFKYKGIYVLILLKSISRFSRNTLFRYLRRNKTD